MKRVVIAGLCALFLLAPPASKAQTVYRAPADLERLDSRIDWAAREAAGRGQNLYWMAYSVKRMMKENSWMGSFGSEWESLPTLTEVLSGNVLPKSESETLQDAARRALEAAGGRHTDTERRSKARSENEVEKEVVVLMLLEGRDRALSDVDLSNIELAFDFENHPVYWLGPTTDRESIDYLTASFDQTKDADVQEDLVAAVGMHETFSLAKPFLMNVIASSKEGDVRESAVFWLSRDDAPETVDYLAELADSDPDGDVQEQAVFALSRMSSDSALDVMIRLARSADDEDVRETSRFWLGQKASRKLFGDIREPDQESELQKQAVFALAQLDDDGGVDELIKLVRGHGNAVVRKQALFWLGQSEDRRALDAIVSILRPGS